MCGEKKRVRVNCNTQHMANHMELAALGGAWDLAWNTQGAKLWHISISHLLNYKHSDVHSQETTVSKHQLTDAHPFYTHLVKNIFAQTSKPQLDAESLWLHWQRIYCRPTSSMFILVVHGKCLWWQLLWISIVPVCSFAILWTWRGPCPCHSKVFMGLEFSFWF